MMRAIIEARNDAVYRNQLPTLEESRALLAIWDAVAEWFRGKGITLE
jgi:hypothetical protein